VADQLSHYELLERLGTGGMGAVWRARDTRDGSIVAVKVLHPHLGTDASYVRRFEREARIAASLASPHLVRVLDSGAQGELRFLVMEYVEGKTLAQLIQERGRLDVEETVAIATTIARALDAAHAAGIVHRDISPQNVLIQKDGAVKVTDFGVARDLGATAMTATSMLLGKPQYIAPEVVTGASPVDIRSDIYSLGVVVYQMLTGAVPFSAETPYAVMQMHANLKPPSLAQLQSDTPAWLVEVVERCLEKNPQARFLTPTELLTALQQRSAGASLPGPVPATGRVEDHAAESSQSPSAGRAIALTGRFGRRVGKVFSTLFIPLTITSLLFVVLLLAGVILVLLPTSLPSGCSGPDNGALPLPVLSDTHVASFNTKLDGLKGQLEAGNPGSAAFTNDELTSRVLAYLQESGNGSLSQLSVCVEPHGASLAAVYTPSSLKPIKLYADASLFLTGEPRVHISDVRVGKLPALGPVRSVVEGVVNDFFLDLSLKYDYEVSYDYNALTISGAPKSR
jgi:serine/threonine protein kinase